MAVFVRYYCDCQKYIMIDTQRLGTTNHYSLRYQLGMRFTCHHSRRGKAKNCPHCPAAEHRRSEPIRLTNCPSPDLSGRVCGTAADNRATREAEGQVEGAACVKDIGNKEFKDKCYRTRTGLTNGRQQLGEQLGSIPVFRGYTKEQNIVPCFDFLNKPVPFLCDGTDDRIV